MNENTNAAKLASKEARTKGMGSIRTKVSGPLYATCALHDTCARHGAPKSSPVRAVSASAERVWVRTLRAAENSEERTVEWYLGTHGQGRCRNTGPPGPESSQCLSAGMKFEPHRNGG